MEARYTAWHYFLVDVMQHLIDERHLEIHPFEKLGTLPLEATAPAILGQTGASAPEAVER